MFFRRVDGKFWTFLHVLLFLSHTNHLVADNFFFSDEREEEEYEKEEVGEDGEIILVSGDKVSGPWNKSGAPPPAAAAAPDGEQ